MIRLIILTSKVWYTKY